MASGRARRGAQLPAGRPDRYRLTRQPITTSTPRRPRRYGSLRFLEPLEDPFRLLRWRIVAVANDNPGALRRGRIPLDLARSMHPRTSLARLMVSFRWVGSHVVLNTARRC